MQKQRKVRDAKKPERDVDPTDYGSASHTKDTRPRDFFGERPRGRVGRTLNGAGVAEAADAPALEAGGSACDKENTPVRVRTSPPVPFVTTIL